MFVYLYFFFFFLIHLGIGEASENPEVQKVREKCKQARAHREATSLIGVQEMQAMKKD